MSSETLSIRRNGELKTKPKQPTLIFVPGAWHNPSCYSQLVNILANPPHNHKCLCVTLPSVNSAAGSPSRQSFQPDINEVRQTIQNEFSNLREVILITHSYGSIVGSEALKPFRHSKMIKWLVIGGFLLKVGESAVTMRGGVIPPLWDIQVRLTGTYLQRYVISQVLRSSNSSTADRCDCLGRHY